ncbi:type IV pilus biogenesis/stability protein PilW [Pseudomonas sp. C27(2019)]|uniref:type IV pilus biogenesis/stability protein PilW n=1 Tax=Pseudomonas sp. C27(2019) TaxID=2604941 RepID=UPI001245DE53|nr:type IV pilus biogenesis/stability protein PilW [Pseudomonas sp. C27(2019)]QEY58361.1 type IV pilus biogenesis/stability protein PilW [Pseudomonas sp. C27(2019)]
MNVRTGLLLALCVVLSACVSSGNKPPLRTEEGRNQARDAYIQLGIGYLQQGSSEQAKMPLQKALDIDSNSADAHAALALVFQNELEPELADQHFRKALSQGVNPRIQNNYGSFLYEQGEYQKAFEQFTAASKDTMYGGRSRVFENMGLTALRLDNKPLAMKHFERSLRLNPQQPRALLEMALLLYERQDYVPAQRYYQSFTQLSEHSARSLLLGSRLAKIFQDRNQAASLGLQLKRLYPASAEYKQYQSEQ